MKKIILLSIILLTLSGCACSAPLAPAAFVGNLILVVVGVSLTLLGVVLNCELQRCRAAVMFVLAFLIMAAIGLLSLGCARDAQLIKFQPAPKSTTAENAKVYGDIAAGAWDCLFTKGSE